jgi:hypothetical protein
LDRQHGQSHGIAIERLELQELACMAQGLGLKVAVCLATGNQVRQPVVPEREIASDNLWVRAAVAGRSRLPPQW